MVAFGVILQSWCALWIFLALRGVQLLGPPDPLDRWLSIIVAFGGLAFALWCLYLVHRLRKFTRRR